MTRKHLHLLQGRYPDQLSNSRLTQDNRCHLHHLRDNKTCSRCGSTLRADLLRDADSLESWRRCSKGRAANLKFDFSIRRSEHAEASIGPTHGKRFTQAPCVQCYCSDSSTSYWLPISGQHTTRQPDRFTDAADTPETASVCCEGESASNPAPEIHCAASPLHIRCG